MVNNDSLPITRLLEEWGHGNAAAFEQLLPLVYEELRRMAKRHLRRQEPGHTFQTTDLIHEAYLKLAAGSAKEWQNREHFFGVSSQAMRHILVDHARSKQSKKRGESPARITFEESAVISKDGTDRILALNAALNALGELDNRKMQVVEMKFFGGLNMEEISAVLKVSVETVKRDWRFSRTWLLRELE